MPIIEHLPARRRFMLQGLAGGAGLMAGLAYAAQPVAGANARVDALLARMTVEEKAGQLTLYPDAIRPTPRPINPDMRDRAAEEAKMQWSEIRAGRVGALLGGTGVALGRQLQQAALESRLGIPLLFGADIVHGLRTIYPLPLAQAASFEPDLARRTARAAAIEASAHGLHWTYAPMVDVARDQRWGRVAEGAGEDVYLNCLFAAAQVEGFQGTNLRAHDAMLATPKHLAGYGGVIGGMEYNSTEFSERELRQTYLPPFQAAFKAGALSTMSAFNDVDGVPASANRRLLTAILRDEWGFEGFVVSDALSAEEVVNHGFAADQRAATLLALQAGLDMNMGSGMYLKHVPELVASGELPMAVLDRAVRRILLVKEAIGLFDDPFRSLSVEREQSATRMPEHLALAREAARKSIVMLKNEKDLLPLSAAGQRIALIGPLGDDPRNMDGTWAPWAIAGDAVTLAAGLRAAMRNPAMLTVVRGSDIDRPIKGGIAQAVAAARAAEVVLLAIGESQDMSGEAAARSDIGIPPAQLRLAEAVAATGKPVVVLLSCGRALALKGAVRDADAILVNWFLGSQAGHAIADILFGRVSPSGRLPVSFPQESGQQPYYYNHKATGRAQLAGEGPAFKARYKDVSHTALYPFGFGLTYSTLSYGPTRVDRERMTWNGKVTVSATVRNTGKVAIEEVVQLYIHDRVASITQPVRQLKGIRKIALAAGEERDVVFDVDRSSLEFVGSDLRWIAEPGAFDAWIAPSATAGSKATFMLDAA
jgi:beta-glucosidase